MSCLLIEEEDHAHVKITESKARQSMLERQGTLMVSKMKCLVHMTIMAYRWEQRDFFS